MTEAIWLFFLGIGSSWHAVLLGLISVIETLFPPFPGDVLYVALSGLGVSRHIPLVLLLLPGFLGSSASTLLLDSMGRSSKLEKMENLIIRSSGKNSFLRAKKILARRGSWILIFSRFIPGIRSLLVIAAASSGMKKSTVFLCTSLSIVLWYALLVFAGTVIGIELKGASDFMAELTAILLMLSLAAVIIAVVVSLIRLKRSE